MEATGDESYTIGGRSWDFSIIVWIFGVERDRIHFGRW
jgi:hypothetical protein